MEMDSICLGCMFEKEDVCVFKCGHFLCSDCATASAERCNAVLKAYRLEGKKQYYFCDICNKYFDEKVDQKRVVQKDKEIPDRKCMMDESCKAAEWYTYDDGPKFVCNAHKVLLEKYHEGKKVFVKIEEMPNRPAFMGEFVDNKCEKHNKLKELFCRDCKNGWICQQCREEDHKGHHIDVNIIDRILKKRQEIQIFISSMKECKIYPSNDDPAKLIDDIKRKFNELIATLEKDRDDIEKKIKDLFRIEFGERKKKEDILHLMEEYLEQVVVMSGLNLSKVAYDELTALEKKMTNLDKEARFVAERFEKNKALITFKWMGENAYGNGIADIDYAPLKCAKYSPVDIFAEIVNSKSERTGISCIERNWSYGGSVYCSKQNVLLLNSWGINACRDFVAVFFKPDGTTKRSTKFTNLLPAQHTWCMRPMYDGKKYVYIYAHKSPCFIRIDMDTEKCEQLPAYDGKGEFSEENWSFQNGDIFTGFRAHTSECHLGKFNTETQKWSTIKTHISNNARFHPHPTKPGICVEINETNTVLEYPMSNPTRITAYKAKFPYTAASQFFETCILSDGLGGFVLIAKKVQENCPWYVFSSECDAWEEIPGWTHTRNKTRHMCYVPEHKCFYLCVQGDNYLHRVPFNLITGSSDPLKSVHC